MIERLNILELFGADKNKYHSCIITCFSFDFIFFEQRVLPALRKAGMININIFVDARMYQQQLANLDGNYISKQSYNITPIKLNGAFHPKILMGIGKNNGFLAIGSGNLTNSGLSSNDEVWGAFHTFKTESKALPIFQTAFEYLKSLKPFCYGSNIQKWDWLIKNSQWLSDISNASINDVAINNNEELILLKSFADASIYNQLLENLPKEALENLTIISPYYNKNGSFLTNLLNDLKPETVDIVVDSRFGTVPYQFTSQEHIQFHEWEGIKNNGKKESPRLHAKIIQFKYKNETWILTGSTNASIEAFGTKTTISRNAEMSILLKSNENKNWIEELDIQIPLKGTFNLSSYNKELIPSNSFISQTFEYQINYAELDLLQLSIYISNSNKLPEGSFIGVEKTDDKITFYPITNNNSTPMVVELIEQDVKLGYRVYIANSLKQRISYYEKIHNAQLIQRTNPDTKSSKFLEIINGTELGNSDLETLLEFANFEDRSQTRNANVNTVTAATSKQSEQETKEYNKVTEEEFNKNENEIERRFENATSHLTLLEEFLNNMTFNDAGEDFSDSSERDAERAKDSGIGGDGVVNEQVVLTFHEGQRLKNKLHKKLDEINTVIIRKHSDVLFHLVDNKKSNNKASIENLQSLLVGTHLIFMKLDEKFYEERIRLIVKYKTIADLAKFEKVRGINLERIENQGKLGDREVAFSADGNVINEIKKIVADYKDIELISADETPSISIEHNFFQENPIFSKSTPDLSSKKGFLMNTVAPFLLVLTNGVKEYSPQELMKFNAFKKRLFYRVLVLILCLKWKNKEARTLELLLLNVFYQLLPKNITIDDVLIELEQFKNKLNISENKIKKNEKTLVRVLNSFLEWKEVFDNNREELIKELNRNSIGRIIFKSSYGFSIISSNFQGVLNLNTPLGVFNDNTKEYEVKNVRSGITGIIY